MNLTKTLFGILIVTAGYSFIPCIQTRIFASGSNELCNVVSSSKVYLKGSLSTPTTRSVFQPIEVFQEDKTLMIYYLCELGEIEISLSNEQGSIVYSKKVSISKSTQTLIRLNDFSSGNYTIKLKNVEGEELSGLINIK
ncbi:DUF3244 domain-containing protein [Parabacteroides sp. BX2]|jgi:hypothetical protein|uniref:DUF3244 domain-containing protein n=1 Tax=Parabacteroides segnis TaxID=2763058 RepID=A0ABR7DZ93_9BACT|nr:MULTISPECIES: DUF3244 domain-containing protein [Parabacteroides]MBC5642802.1 DUF3244 domain-containing protein [Parabacteroides segnis]MCM0713830.1 DUF3244 domain-containing protein [Parabacteroides sp. TA-V-105]